MLGVDYHDASVMHARAAAAEAGLENVRFEVGGRRAELPGSDVDLVTFFDSLHDLGDPRGALVRAREALAPDGRRACSFEPLGADRVADNLNPGGRMFYAVSTLICTPNAVSQRTEHVVAAAGHPGRRSSAARASRPRRGSARCAGSTSRRR